MAKIYKYRTIDMDGNEIEVGTYPIQVEYREFEELRYRFGNHIAKVTKEGRGVTHVFSKIMSTDGWVSTQFNVHLTSAWEVK